MNVDFKEFDDLGMYRRKVEKLEQNIATMALEIGVLKQERAHLYHLVKDFRSTVEFGGQWDELILRTDSTLTQIKIS